MWLYVPNLSTSSPSAPEELGSISASNWQFQALEQCAWSKGKPSPARNWYQRWKRDISLQRLFGAMPEPSTADAGADAWMASLAASRASLTVLPANNSAKTTRETSGQPPVESSSNQARGSPLSKTSGGCSPAAARNEYGETFADWALRLREDCSRRQKSAQAMSANACSSSLWPTMRAGDGAVHQLRQNVTNPRGRLEDVVSTWQASAWPTPTANDWKGSGPTLERSDGKMRGDRLDYATEQMWSMPRASDGEKGGPNQSFGAGGIPLAAQTAQWATPSVADTTGGRMTRSGARSNEPLLKGQSERLTSSLQDRIIYPVGQTSSHPRRSLNPLFVEWLMGWPPGWTLLAWTDLGCSATELSAWKRRMRFALLQLGLPAEAPPAQTDLFA